MNIKIRIDYIDESKDSEKQSKKIVDGVICLFFDKDGKISSLVKQIIGIMSAYSNEEVSIDSNLSVDHNNLVYHYVNIYKKYFVKLDKYSVNYNFEYSASERTKILTNAFTDYMLLCQTTSNIITPETLVNHVRDKIKEYNIVNEVNVNEIICDKDSQFQGIYAVGKAGESNPRLAIIKFGSEEVVDYCLVGKGVTYDCGGLSLKPSEYMHDMHQDMGGAALSFYTSLVSYVLTKKSIICVMPLVENLIDTKAYRVGDIINTYSGKKVYVKNTDAEGRIILADAVAYSYDKLKFKHMIVMATLTGAAHIINGKGGLVFFTDHEDMKSNIYKNLKISEERGCDLPMDEYCYSAISYETDCGRIEAIRNTGGGAGASSTTAATFVIRASDRDEYLKKSNNDKKVKKSEIRYAHFDIANMFEDSLLSGNTSMNLLELCINIVS